MHHNAVKLLRDIEGMEFSFIKRPAPGQDYQVRAAPAPGMVLSSGRHVFCIDLVGARHPFEDGTTELVDANMDAFEEAILAATEHVTRLVQPEPRRGGRV